MESVKRKIISFWLTHIFLRRIGKRYPDFFNNWMKDITDSRSQRKIMALRYTGDTPMKFEAIAVELNTTPRRVFEQHKKVINRLIVGTQPA